MKTKSNVFKYSHSFGGLLLCATFLTGCESAQPYVQKFIKLFSQTDASPSVKVDNSTNQPVKVD